MNFKDLHLKYLLQRIFPAVSLLKFLFRDKRLSNFIIFFVFSLFLCTSMVLLYNFQKESLSSTIATLDIQAKYLHEQLKVKRHQAAIPQFEKALHGMGAYCPSLTTDVCLKQLAGRFLQTKKPLINIEFIKQDTQNHYSLDSYSVHFQSSFDYEIFEMMDYILVTPEKFGYTRLREFEIEQLFDTFPIVKGRFVYDQLSLKP